MNEIIISACETIEETIKTAVEQLHKQQLDRIIFFFTGSKYRIEKDETNYTKENK